MNTKLRRGDNMLSLSAVWVLLYSLCLRYLLVCVQLVSPNQCIKKNGSSSYWSSFRTYSFCGNECDHLLSSNSEEKILASSSIAFLSAFPNKWFRVEITEHVVFSLLFHPWPHSISVCPLQYSFSLFLGSNYFLQQ